MGASCSAVGRGPCPETAALGRGSGVGPSMAEVVESLPLPVVIVGEDLRIAALNLEARRALHAPDSEATGRSFKEWLEQEAGTGLEHVVKELSRRPVSPTTLQAPATVSAPLIGRNGRRMPYSMRIRLVRPDAGGASTAAARSWFAMTMICSAPESTTAAGAAREDVLGFVTHEVRNALAPVRIAVEDLLANADPPSSTRQSPTPGFRPAPGSGGEPSAAASEGRVTPQTVGEDSEGESEGRLNASSVLADTGTLRLLQRATTDAMDILNGVLDIERLRRGHGLMTAWFPVGDMMEQARAAAGMVGAASGIAVDLHIDKRLAFVEVDGSELKLAQCVSNFVSNSVKLTPGGGSVTLYATLEEEDPEGVLTLSPSAATAGEVAAADRSTAQCRQREALAASVDAAAGGVPAGGGRPPPAPAPAAGAPGTAAGTLPLPHRAELPLSIAPFAAAALDPDGHATQHTSSLGSLSAITDGDSIPGVVASANLSVGAPSRLSGATVPSAASQLPGLPLLGPPSLAFDRGPTVRLVSTISCPPRQRVAVREGAPSAGQSRDYSGRSRHSGPTMALGGVHHNAWEATEMGSAGRGEDLAPGAAVAADYAEQQAAAVAVAVAATAVAVVSTTTSVAVTAGGTLASAAGPSSAPTSSQANSAGQEGGQTVSSDLAGSDGGAVSETTAWLRRCWIRIGVRDSGPGVAPTDRTRLFRPFTQLQDRSSAAGMGTGLGLAFVREVVEKGHSGRVGVTGHSPLPGADFFFLLPGARARLTNAWGTFPLPEDTGSSADGKSRGVWRSADNQESTDEGISSRPSEQGAGTAGGAETDRQRPAREPPARNDLVARPKTSGGGGTDEALLLSSMQHRGGGGSSGGGCGGGASGDAVSIGNASSQPSAAGATQQVSGHHRTVDTKSSTSQELQGARVLVVDDSPLTRRLLAQTLRKRGLEIHTAGRGETALELLESSAARGEPFDCLVTDWHMPGCRVQGEALVEETRKKYPNTVVIVISGADSAATANAHACLTKPVGSADLYVSIRRNVLRMRRKAAHASQNSQQSQQSQQSRQPPKSPKAQT